VESLKYHGLETAVYDQVESNPKDYNVMDAVTLYQENKCDSFVSIGGGSSHDACKGARIAVAHDVGLRRALRPGAGGSRPRRARTRGAPHDVGKDRAMSTAEIDPLAPGVPGVVVHGENVPGSGVQIVHTEHFRLCRRGRVVELTHRLRPEQIDNDLAGLLATELSPRAGCPGRTGSSRWRAAAGAPGHSTIAGIAPVYRRALTLVGPGSVLDLGSCFGFFPLLLTERGHHAVVASDIGLETLVCDAARVPLPDRSIDTVTVLHLLEHLDPAAW